SGDALELLRGRLLLHVGLSWLPLLILCALQGTAWGPADTAPFLRDIEAQARFLLVIPLLVGAAIVVHQRLRFVASQFQQPGLIPDAARRRFEAAVTSTVRLRNSVVAEIAIILFVYVVGLQLIRRQHASLETATWYGATGAGGWTPSRAGRWYLYFSLQ